MEGSEKQMFKPCLRRRRPEQPRNRDRKNEHNRYSSSILTSSEVTRVPSYCRALFLLFISICWCDLWAVDSSAALTAVRTAMCTFDPTYGTDLR